jgi:hypothetical protein
MRVAGCFSQSRLEVSREGLGEAGGAGALLHLGTGCHDDGDGVLNGRVPCGGIEVDLDSVARIGCHGMGALSAVWGSCVFFMELWRFGGAKERKR